MKTFIEIIIATVVAGTLMLAIVTLTGCAAPSTTTTGPGPEETVSRQDLARTGMESVRMFSHGALGPSAVRTY